MPADSRTAKNGRHRLMAPFRQSVVGRPPGYKDVNNALPDEVGSWLLTRTREKIIKIGAKLITHARYSIFQMAEVALPRNMFRRILELIGDFRSRPSVPC